MNKKSTYPTPDVVAKQISKAIEDKIETRKEDIPTNKSSSWRSRLYCDDASVILNFEIANKFEPENTNGAFSDAVPGLYENTWKLLSIDSLWLYDKDGNESDASKEFIYQVKELL